MIEKITLTKIGKYKDDWVFVYIEPNDAHSKCGGRITVNIGDDYIGSYFFSHCGTETFEQFLAKVNPDYLINKLFQTKEDLDVESGSELFESLVKNDMLWMVKHARNENNITKDELRELYEGLKEHAFRDIGELSYMIDSDSYETMSKIFSDDWFYNGGFTKSNHVYERQENVIQAVIAHFKNEVTS
ncbi:hypothetical protein ACG94X_02335 [Acinetobacter sp. ULE_I010]|uniref:hypothetical protein n=1 Tax=Acinetobacter sp. ULE_I010 TaxID=3373065 RepID=UPI003AF814B4